MMYKRTKCCNYICLNSVCVVDLTRIHKGLPVELGIELKRSFSWEIQCILYCRGGVKCENFGVNNVNSDDIESE